MSEDSDLTDFPSDIPDSTDKQESVTSLTDFAYNGNFRYTESPVHSYRTTFTLDISEKSDKSLVRYTLDISEKSGKSLINFRYT